MDAKTAQFLSKLMLEDDEDDIVSFTFPNQKKKIKCSISMLSEISPVFEAMFSSRWCEEGVDNIQLINDVKFDQQFSQVDAAVSLISRDKTIQLSDDVKFDQYSTFKKLMEILYGLRKIESLTVDQAIDVYYYSNKYQINDVSDKIQKFLNKRMKTAMSSIPLSVAELTESIGFAEMYHLDELKSSLDQVKLAFDENNVIQFWDLATKFEMKTLQKQVVDHVKTLASKQDWPTNLLLAVIECLKADEVGVKEECDRLKKEREVLKVKWQELSNCMCTQSYSLHCSECGGSSHSISSVLNKMC